FFMQIKDVLKQKGHEVFTIDEDKTIFQAMDVLVKNQIGSLLVMNEDGNITGIFSERDALRECFKNEGNCKDIIVKNVMSKNIIFAEADDNIDYVMGIMTKNRIRHVPVLKDKVLVGIVSIGDIVKASLNEQQFENKYLKDYFYGQAPS
ncbi:MAG: CBS domain-containing protein, partial [Candidatus Kapaibacteriota bacterium]